MLRVFSRKSEGVIGIDVSSTSVKLVELARVRGGYELKSFAMVPLPRDAIVENTVIDSMAVSQALLDSIELANPSSRNVALAVSGNAVIIKTVQMALVSEFELESAIQYEADQHIPYDIEDVFLDFQIIGPTEEDPDQMDVVLAACKRDVIEDLQLVMNEAGLQAKCVDCCVFCLENAYELINEQQEKNDELGALDDDELEEEAYALVNIGANLININIVLNGQMTFVRDQFYGGQNLTEEIQKAHGVSFQSADDMKKNNFSSIDPEAVENFYVGLTAELVRSLDFYAATHAEHPVQKILVSGGAALLPDLATELEQRLGIETIILNPMTAIKVPKSKFDIAELEALGSMMMVPIGLALRAFD
ncbi:MAG: type IV pilus assembly protein PilM [Mariprofundales bacterium]